MDLYFRRQFAARANDFVRGNMGHTIAISMGNVMSSRLQQELSRPLGDEPYLAMDFILGQYGLDMEFDLSGGVILIGKKPMSRESHRFMFTVTIPPSVFISTFDATLENSFLMWAFSGISESSSSSTTFSSVVVEGPWRPIVTNSIKTESQT